MGNQSSRLWHRVGPTGAGKRASVLWMVAIALCSILVLVLATPATPHAVDGLQVESFESRAKVERTGCILVDERITVCIPESWVNFAAASGRGYARGIFRQVRTRYWRGLGPVSLADIQLLGATEDGKPTGCGLRSDSGGTLWQLRNHFASDGEHICIWFRRDRQEWQPGVHTYTIRYRLGPVVQPRDRRDELDLRLSHDQCGILISYPGGGDQGRSLTPVSLSGMMIGSASIDIDLGDRFRTSDVGAVGAYVQGGRRGVLEPSAVSSGHRCFRIPGAMLGKDHVEIRISWPDGYVTRLNRRERLTKLVDDNHAATAGFAGLIVLLAFWGISWLCRRFLCLDVYPCPPDGVSPSLAGYLLYPRREHDHLLSAVVELAVKGFATIECAADALYVTKVRGADSPYVSLEAEAVASRLYKSHSRVCLEAGAVDIERVRALLASSVRKHAPTRTPGRDDTSCIGWLITMLSTVVSIYLLLDNREGNAGGLLLGGNWFGVIGAGLLYAWRCEPEKWPFPRRSRRRGPARLDLSKIGYSIAIPLVFALAVLWWWDLPRITSLLFSVPMLIMPVLSLLYRRMTKPRMTVDPLVVQRTDGFCRYLAGGRRRDGAEPQSAALFEEYLPYALALGVERQWAEQAESARGGDHFEPPTWFHSRTVPASPTDLVQQIRTAAPDRYPMTGSG